jgi:hypothetical protein
VWRAQISWDNMIYPTTVLLAQLTDNPAFHASAQAFLQKWLCSSGDTISYTPLGRAYNRFDPSLGQTMHAALVSVIYGQAIQPPPDAPKPFQARALPALCEPSPVRLPFTYITTLPYPGMHACAAGRVRLNSKVIVARAVGV